MNSKNFFDRAGRRFGRELILLLRMILCKLPFPLIRLSGSILGSFSFLVLRKKRKRVMENLKAFFLCEKGEEEVKEIAKKYFKNVATNFIESFTISRFPAHFLKEVVEVKGKEHLEEAIKKGKGIIGISGHLSNFVLLMARVAKEGYRVNVVIRGEKDKGLEKLFFEERTALGINSVYKDASPFHMTKLLRKNEILWLFLDQFPRSGERFVDFFHLKVPFYDGAVRFAKSMGSPIIPFSIKRKTNGYVIEIMPEVKLHWGYNREEDIIRNYSQLIKIIEDLIQKYPEEWFWWQRRWKRYEGSLT